MMKWPTQPSVGAGSLRISDLRFDNRNLRDLPCDQGTEDSRRVENAVWARSLLQPIRKPFVVAYSEDALALLGVNPELIDEREIEMYLSGNEVIPNSGCNPYAHCYCGHQFGSFAGQLGDGAAMYLGEVDNGGTRYELALKGSGKTAFSRKSDGRKVLRSSIREFLGSEANHHLGIPTTRSGSCVTSTSTVQRDPFYDGHVVDEPCTVIARIAPTFLRFGSFEIFKEKHGSSDREGPAAGNQALKKQLLEYAIENYFTFSKGNVYGGEICGVLARKCERAAKLTASWDTTGFVHGVLNTDNMSILGLTIDYGPYAFMEHFDSDMTPNGSDSTGRYTWAKQHHMVEWNLGKLLRHCAPLCQRRKEKQSWQNLKVCTKLSFWLLFEIS